MLKKSKIKSHWRHSYTTPEIQCRQHWRLGRRQRRGSSGLSVRPSAVHRPPSICPSVSLSVRHPSVCPSDRMGYWDQTTKEQQNVHTFDCRMRKCKRCTYIRVCKCDRRSYFTALSRNLRPLFFFLFAFHVGSDPPECVCKSQNFRLITICIWFA